MLKAKKITTMSLNVLMIIKFEKTYELCYPKFNMFKQIKSYQTKNTEILAEPID